MPRGRLGVCVCVCVYLCVCVYTQILNFLVFYFPSLRCFAFLLCSALHSLFCFGISVYFFQKKIYVKCSGNGAAGVGVGVDVTVAVAVSVDVEIVTDAAAAVSFNGVKKQNCQKSTSLFNPLHPLQPSARRLPQPRDVPAPFPPATTTTRWWPECLRSLAALDYDQQEAWTEAREGAGAGAE